MLGYASGMGPGSMRDAVCEVLLKRPDPNNWSPGNIENEVHRMIDGAPWWKIYDIAERLYLEIGKSDFARTQQTDYERRLNHLFREQGVGSQMENGVIAVRGSEAFALTTRDAVDTMRDAGNPTAANEIHEALTDISRRPTADVTGAIEHAMAALECVAREIDGSSDTLGRIIGRLALPPPLDGALHKLYEGVRVGARPTHQGKAAAPVRRGRTCRNCRLGGQRLFASPPRPLTAFPPKLIASRG